MKRLSLFVLAISLACGAAAQDLHSTSFVDQLNVGSRGNDEGTTVIVGNPSATATGPAMTDGSDFLEYNGADLTISGASTAVKYVNTWGTHGGDAVESPIVDVTLATNQNPDRPTFLLPQIWANDRPDATGDNTAILIGDDGGYNALFFGESRNRNYYVEVDMFLPVATVSAGNEYAGLVARAARDDGADQPDRRDWSYSPFYEGSYGIIYEYQTNTLKTVTFTPVTSGAPVRVEHNSQSGIAEGWHTLRIECVSDTVKFFVDGLQVGPDLLDTTASVGRPGIFYSEASVTSAAERQGVFDRISAGPIVASEVDLWSLY